MTIAIDASKLEITTKTGTEVYAETLILGLLQCVPAEHSIILYSRKPLAQAIISKHPRISNICIGQTYFWTLGGLSWALWRDKPDVFYTPASIIPPLHPKKSIIVIHGLEYEAFPQAYSLLRFWHLALFTQLSAKWAATVIVPTQATKDDLCAEYGINPSKVEVIYSGIPQLDSSEQNPEAEVMIQTYLESLYIFWIGRKELRKNLITLIQAFNQVKQEYPDLKLILAGSPGYGYAEIQKAIRKSKYREDIIELGWVSNQTKQRLYRQARVFVYPSYYEGFGFPILEALSVGVPVLASDIPSSREIGGDMIEYAQSENNQDWAQKLLSILSHSHPRSELNKNQIQSWLQQFNFAKTIQKTQHILLD